MDVCDDQREKNPRTSIDGHGIDGHGRPNIVSRFQHWPLGYDDAAVGGGEEEGGLWTDFFVVVGFLLLDFCCWILLFLLLLLPDAGGEGVVVSRHDHTNGGEGAPEYGYPLQKAIDARKAGLSSPTSSPSSPARYLSTANVRVRLNFGQNPFVCPVSWEACLVAKYRRLYEEGVLEGSCALDDSANVWLRRLRAMLIDDGYTAEEVSMGWWWWLGGGWWWVFYLFVGFVCSFVALLLSLSLVCAS